MTKKNTLTVPDIYIIGTQKSGTTTLYHWLTQHPQLYGHPLAKDYGYFGLSQTDKDQLHQFLRFQRDSPPESQTIGGEANAMYTAFGPQRMRNLIPSAKLIAILRNPVDRAFSAYAYAVERMMETRTFAQAIHEELAEMVYEHEDALQRDYLGHGNYARQLQEVYKYYRRDQVKVLIFEELREKPEKVLVETFQFLGVTNDFKPNMSVKNETKGGLRYPWLAPIIYGRPSNELIRKTGKLLIPYSLRTGIRRKLETWNRVEKNKPEFTAEAKSLLEDYYKAEIQELELLLNKEITEWRKP